MAYSSACCMRASAPDHEHLGGAIMKALYLAAADGVDSATVTDVETPSPAPGQVRVAIKAASLNHRELWIPQGAYPGMKVPTTLGCDGVATQGLAFAVATGARVFVTGENDEVIARAKAMGAQDGLNFTDPDWRKKLLPMTGGVDVVMDGAPGPSFGNYVRSLNPGARV